ncbi:hypothetical protein [Bradyrhizobium sp. JYMT SZCCT0180]|uniref:hypothetical protein n=1 Tax=Bradyrhizobium sp. JYMT SZCCT0180 TaxID=2807666 RepID=UPI001BAE0C2B|nr:hypothetical protein [Bradyrhizobium sp. JYMT SZCCT0180]MBR1209961.1 hypothetical protein [Bradyrhizobium sp. JYMT SZCCT0180]
MKPPREERPDNVDRGATLPLGNESQADGGIISHLKSGWEFIKDVLPKNDPLRRASAWFLVALALVGILLTLRASAGSAEAASAFIFVFVGVLAVVAFVNVLYVVIPGERGAAPRAYAFGRAIIAGIILAVVVVVSAPFRATISRDGPSMVLSWLHAWGWVSISDAVAAMPMKYKPTTIPDGRTLLTSHRLDPFEDPRNGIADIDARRLFAALSNRDHIQVVGTVTVADTAAPHDTFGLVARKVRFADGARIEIGRSSLLIVTEVLEIGDKAEHRASVVAFGGTPPTGTSGRKGLNGGNLTIIVTDKVANGTLAVDLRGSDGENGSSGKPGKSGESFEPKTKPAAAKGFLVKFQTAPERAGGRDAISKIRSDHATTNRCSDGTECWKTLDSVEKYLAFCDKDASLCPTWTSSVCFLPAEPGANVPGEEKYNGKAGEPAGNGGDGGDGGALLVVAERTTDELRIVLDPAVGSESADRRTRPGAASGGAAGTAGSGGPGAKAIEGGDNDSSKICGMGQPGTQGASGPSGPPGSHGRAGKPHERTSKSISSLFP